MTRIIVGGLGGGDDVGLALILTVGLGLQERVNTIVSFSKCRAGGSRGVGRRVAGALTSVAGEDLGRRGFEDKALLVAPWVKEAYLVCVKEPWNMILEAMDYIAENLGVKVFMASNIGGDGILTGYESKLGSYTTDTLARAALAYIADKHGVKTVITSAAIGAEGGGGELDHAEIYATLHHHKKHRAIIAGWMPKPENTWPAQALLAHAESGMLPILIAAIHGQREATVNQACLHGTYKIKPWYKYTLLLEATTLCRDSPLCLAAKEGGAKAIKNWDTKKKRPPRDYTKRLKEAQRLREQGRLDHAMTIFLKQVLRHKIRLQY